MNIEHEGSTTTSLMLRHIRSVFHSWNTVSFLEVFGVSRVRSTVHNWVHKADLQPETGRDPNLAAVDETVIQLNDEQYWLYATVDPESNNLLHTRLEPTRNNAIADPVFLRSP